MAVYKTIKDTCVLSEWSVNQSICFKGAVTPVSSLLKLDGGV